MRINIFGSSGTGKSTLVAWLFSELKIRHYSIALIDEAIKTWAYQDVKPHGWRGFKIFSQQLIKEYELLWPAAPAHLISDSPILLSAIYSELHKKSFAEYLLNITRNFDSEYPCINIILTRNVPYIKEGRYETEEESKNRDEFITNFVEDYSINMNIPYLIENPENRTIILNWILDYLNETNYKGILYSSNNIKRTIATLPPVIEID